MKIEVTRQHAYSVAVVLFILASIVLVTAYGTSNPPIMGHSVLEIDWSGALPSLTVTGTTTFNGPVCIGSVCRTTWPTSGNINFACPSGQFVRAFDSNGVAVCGAVCTPTAQATACSGRSCGTVADGCGGSYTCGASGGNCPSGQVCNSGGSCVSSCTPTPQATACGSRVCGTVSNGCGGSYTCGSSGGGCPSGQVCNSGGACVSSCTPQTFTQACSGASCGVVGNGCGTGTYDCGGCEGSYAGYACTSGTCQVPTTRYWRRVCTISFNGGSVTPNCAGTFYVGKSASSASAAPFLCTSTSGPTSAGATSCAEGNLCSPTYAFNTYCITGGSSFYLPPNVCGQSNSYYYGNGEVFRCLA